MECVAFKEKWRMSYRLAEERRVEEGGEGRRRVEEGGGGRRRMEEWVVSTLSQR